MSQTDPVIVDVAPFHVEEAELFSQLQMTSEDVFADDVRRLADAARSIGRPKGVYKLAAVEPQTDDTSCPSISKMCVALFPSSRRAGVNWTHGRPRCMISWSNTGPMPLRRRPCWPQSRHWATTWRTHTGPVSALR